MNDRGQIQEFKSDEEAKAAGFNIPLSSDEAEQLQDVSEDDRKIELAWIRFWQNQRKTRKPSEKLPMRHAFITGFRIAVALINED